MKKLVVLFSLLVFTKSTFANEWSMSVGFNNPPGASLGLNFMYLWTNWAFEFGVGQVGSTTSSSTNTTTVSTSGDVNFKYLFGSGWFRPFLQAGTGIGLSVGSNAAAGTGGGFGGLGFYAMGQPIYAYLGYNAGSSSGFQFGVGYRF